MDLAFLEGCCVLPGYSLGSALLRKRLAEPVWCFRFLLSIFEANSQLYYFQERQALKSADKDAHNKQIIFPRLILQLTMHHPHGRSNESATLLPSDPWKSLTIHIGLSGGQGGCGCDCRKTQLLTFLKCQNCKYFQIYSVPGTKEASLF